MDRAVAILYLATALSCNVGAMADGVVDTKQGAIPPGSVAADQGESRGELRLWYDEGGNSQFELSEQRTWFEVMGSGGLCVGAPTYLVKNELLRTVMTEGYHAYTTIDRMLVTVTPVGETNPTIKPYSFSVTPEIHAEFSDTADTVSSGGYLSIQVGDDPYRNFDPATGHLLFRSDDPGRVTPVVVAGNPTFRNAAGRSCYIDRLVSITQRGSVINLGRRFVLEIDYASAEGIIQRVSIETEDQNWLGIEKPDENGQAWIVKPGTMGDDIVTSVHPRDTDAETFDGIAVWIKLDGSKSIEIPISKDRLDTSKAVLPPGFHIASQ